MKKSLYLLVVIVMFFSLFGCGGSNLSKYNEQLDKNKTQLVKDGKLIANYSAKSVKKYLLNKHQIQPDKNIWGFKAYKIPYKTTDDLGNEVNATGLMVVPTDYLADKNSSNALKVIKKTGFAIVLDAHGTIFSNSQAPTVSIANSKSPKGSAVIYSSLYGFITLQPDYIGYGDYTKHPHPYLLKKSSANDMIDFLKAALKFAKENNIPIVVTKDIYLSGYSQGGYVAMATLKRLEDEGYNVKMATPMAGPYFLDAIASYVVLQNNIKYPSFITAVALSYSQVYNIPINTLIQEPYASKLNKLFDKKHTSDQIDKELTTKIKGKNGLFTDYIVNNLLFTNFYAKLHENGVIDFAPTTPVRMIHCLGDDDIPYAISQSAVINLELLGAQDVKLIPVEVALTNDPNTKLRYKHAQCAPYAYKISAKLFSDFRKATLGY